MVDISAATDADVRRINGCENVAISARMVTRPKTHFGGAVKIRFAVSIGSGMASPGHFTSFVTGAEERGFDTLWFADLPLMNETDPTLAVAFAAGLSSRLKLGIDFIPFGHESFVVARQLAQLDQLTDGRLLLTLVPGADLPGERAALGIAGHHRGRLLDTLLPELRRWWSGSAVNVGKGEASAEVTLPVLPRQKPLEIWLGGYGPEAVRRAGRLADGWLGSGIALGPREAGEICRRIQKEAEAVGREVDPEHFGLSIGYARTTDDLSAPGIRRVRAGAGGGPPPSPPVGAAALRDLAEQLIEQGMSKFVVRRTVPVASWPDELDWLADAILDLQT
jgi:alkanesulfonate monooxygenase SsuD/methylene tetrahydromethanopterin reductase-like flavin-dependent oxidoreductase (luciferase family)